MTRTLFLFTATAAVLAGVAAILIRAELTSPGVSWLFQRTDGAPGGHRFNTVVNAHAKFAYLAVMGLGTAMLSVAQGKGAILARALMWVGLIACGGGALIFVMALIPYENHDQLGDGVGWVLYPPLSVNTVLDKAASSFGVDPFWFTMPQFYMLAAGFLLFAGAFAMVSTLPRLRVLGVLGPVLMVLVTGAAAVQMISGLRLPVLNSYVLVSILLLACAAFGLRQTRQTWLVVLCVGIAASILAQLSLMQVLTAPQYAGTTAQAAMLYVFPLGIAWLAAPAAILFHRGVNLPTKSAAFVAAAPLVGLAFWIIPLLVLGRAGMARSYPDYPQVFATMNGVATIGVAAFACLYLAALRTAIKAR